MPFKSTFFTLLFSSIFFTLGNFAFGQFTTKQLTTDISEGMIELDLNNDGEMDILSVGYDSIDGQANHLFYFENNSGTFLAPVSVGEMTSFERNSTLLKADIDNDGFLDVLFFDQAIGKVDFYRNLTNGSLSNPIQIVNQFPDIDGIDLEDMDNDSLIDIVASSRLYNKIVWFKNLGVSGFGTPQFIASSNVSDWTIRLTILDHNQDGNKDVFYVAQETKQLMVATNLGSGIFSAPVQIDYFSNMPNFNFLPILNTFDVNQDGTEDLVVNSYTTGDNIVWYEVIAGVLSPRNELAGFGGINGTDYPILTFSVDIDLDGFNEIVLVDWNDVFYFPNNNGILSSTKVSLITNTESFITNMSIEDFNGDGYPDFMINNNDNGISYYVNNTTLGYTLVQKLSPDILTPWFLVSPDLDSDGLNDIVYFSYSSLKINWLKNQGNGNFSSSQQILDVPTTPIFFSPILKKISAADIDNDGVDDIVSLKGSTSTTHLEYFKNQGNLSFSAPVTISATPVIFDFQTCDLDNDNDVDIVYSSLNNDQIGFFENIGSGNFSTAQIIYSTISDPAHITTADLDNDSDLDIINISTGDDKIRIFENLGNNTFAAPTIVLSQIFSGIYQLLGEDVDGDSLRDIILSSKSTNTVSWLKNLGNGSFSGLNTITTTMNSPEIQPVDYDNDGDLDILCRSNYYALELRGTYLLENIGNGNFLSEGPKIMTVAAFGYTSADFDLDGDLDFASCYQNRIMYTQLELNNKTTATGKVFFDLNQNGLLDSTEFGMTQFEVNTSPNVNYVFSDSIGNYRVNFFDSTVTHNIFTNSLPNWGLTSTPTIYNVTVDSAFTLVDSLNFGFYPSTIFDSVSTNLIGGFPRCNTVVNYWINIGNEGTTIPSGIISLNLDDSLSYISAIPAPDSISNGTLYWSFENLFYFSDTLIAVHVEMPNFLSMGDTLTSSVETAVLDSLNNVVFTAQDNLSQTLVCAYDPNDKTSTPAGIGYPGLVSSEINEVEYLIRFQNTGNDTASIITIKDQLDPNLDWSSMHPICGSHDYSASIDPDGLLTFTFFEINLPDSSTNELASHGFILYKINANSNLPIGTVIENHAEIYFDFNPAVITNYKLLTLFDCASVFDGAPQASVNYCIGDSVQFGIDYPQTDYHWTNISPFLDDYGQVVNIQADSSGFYNVAINAKNSICDIDSIIQYTVPMTPITSVGNTVICQGDSMLIFNQYQIFTGNYYDTLQTQLGCDSILVYELLVNEPPLVNFGTVANDTVCLSGGPIVFVNSSPSGGSYIGNGITSNTFDANTAGIGNHTIYYQYVDPNSCSALDSIVLTVDECLGIKELNEDGISIFPNPTDGKLYLNFKEPFNGNLIIYDLSGKIYFFQTLHESQNVNLKIDGESGVYFLEIKTEDNSKSVIKLIKE